MTTPIEAAQLAGISNDTLKRWLSRYKYFFSPSAVPPKGGTRVLSDHDVRLLIMISGLRDSGLGHIEIVKRLEAARDNNWADLPPMPQRAETITTDLAAGRAGEMVENAVLRRDLQFTRQALQEAQQRAELLSSELEAVRGENTTNTSRIHALEVELERARGEISQLKAQLTGYAFGQDRPINPLVLMALAVLFGVILMIIAIIIGALLT